MGNRHVNIIIKIIDKYLLVIALSGPIYSILAYNVFVILYSMFFLQDIESKIIYMII